jgi:hypothetical protein
MNQVLQSPSDPSPHEGLSSEHESHLLAGIRFTSRLKRPGEAKSGKGGGILFGEAELERLRTSIQLMCQSTNPLGKCMDYVHEDLAMMGTEHERWQAEYRGRLDALDEQKRVGGVGWTAAQQTVLTRLVAPRVCNPQVTEEDVQSLRLQLLELDEQIKEQHQKINSVKCSIAKNDERIDQLLRMVITVSVGSGLRK